MFTFSVGLLYGASRVKGAPTSNVVAAFKSVRTSPPMVWKKGVSRLWHRLPFWWRIREVSARRWRGGGSEVFFRSLRRPVFERGQMGDERPATHALGKSRRLLLVVGRFAAVPPASKSGVSLTSQLIEVSLYSASRHHHHLLYVGAVHGCGTQNPSGGRVLYRTFRAESQVPEDISKPKKEGKKNTNRGQITKLN